MVNPYFEYHQNRHRHFRMLSMYYVTRGTEPMCAYCGASGDLEFDHVDPSAKNFNVSRMTLNDPEFWKELDLCQLLCPPCHRLKTAKENEGYRHGTIYAFMKKKCPCDVCDSAKVEWNASRRTARRGGSGGTEYRRPVEHGERLSYTRGCRCPLCKEANAKAERSRRQEKASK